MKILGIDYGDVRTGVAISDALGITAQGLETIDNGVSEKQLFKRIRELINEYKIEKIVVGFPLNMNATLGPRAQRTEEFIHKLEDAFKVEVIKIDERLTTVAAHKTMTFLGIDKKKKKEIVDTMSAVYILQMYLDRK